MDRRHAALCMICVMPLLSCSGKRPPQLGVADGALGPCPTTPNCVSSDARDASHAVEAYRLALPPEEAWQRIRDEVVRLPRTTLIEYGIDYLHAECASALFGFVDDLELHLRPAANEVAVRSAARLGTSDLGVNRRRVERLRRALQARGVLHQPSVP
jgi:uncharacterized protein (DUF1499 family)